MIHCDYSSLDKAKIFNDYLLLINGFCNKFDIINPNKLEKNRLNFNLSGFKRGKKLCLFYSINYKYYTDN